ncbi:RNA-binding S4 domain-containing protein [Propioniciclava tarda]|uniref:RNA-binding S4 domain-containing protein n=1 Tax=Propioniciclava tarda TaxID=433330 RepID=A0A4Q9KML5_PROTD|nr:S4 domain-containing protein [Propioniciclava tarda]TBT95778.1 RNA-binding S4 domain-containing protein [Propioniciclava tarda]SMO39384.1 heat shock protein Hsp15 [Propioniciclava tarda]HOA88722.1 S4 domain-containing protein [Propioniciclava tarda]HQA30281.1 S4 domain-containing protein [Propioniciclava tarda]
MARLDSWLWGVRLYKTRSAATAGVRGGHVKVNDESAKPAQVLAPGDIVRVRSGEDERIVEVVDASLVKRVGASLAVKAYLDRTPEKPPPIIEMTGRIAVRERGAGRPTKRERRDLDKLRGFEH